VENIISQRISLSEKVIKDIHHLILKNIDDKNAGKYRNINVRISGHHHEPIHHLKVPEQVKDLLDWYNHVADSIDPVELAAMLHFKFVYIHPFVDGNGRTARLLMNFVLMQRGYPPAILKADPQKRLAYYETLEMASVQGDQEPFVKLVAKEVKDSMVKYLSLLS
jgi:Fic family protein